ncbi:MAG: hypothetical protein ACTTH6_03375 [Candidatus Altimarinota bacterium]
MAKILTQHATSGAKTLLLNLLKVDNDWKSGHRLPTIEAKYLAEVPVKLTGLVTRAKEIGWDSHGNPFIRKDDNTRVSLAAVIRCEKEIFVFDRREKYLENLNEEVDIVGSVDLDLPSLFDEVLQGLENPNEEVDIVGSVGFGLPSLFHKVPQGLWGYPVTSVTFTDYMAVETTDGEGDLPNVWMPIVIIDLLSIEGYEKYFVPVPQEDDGMSAKLQAAIGALKSYLFGRKMTAGVPSSRLLLGL